MSSIARAGTLAVAGVVCAAIGCASSDTSGIGSSTPAGAGGGPGAGGSRAATGGAVGGVGGSSVSAGMSGVGNSGGGAAGKGGGGGSSTGGGAGGSNAGGMNLSGSGGSTTTGGGGNTSATGGAGGTSAGGAGPGAAGGVGGGAGGGGGAPAAGASGSGGVTAGGTGVGGSAAGAGPGNFPPVGPCTYETAMVIPFALKDNVVIAFDGSTNQFVPNCIATPNNSTIKFVYGSPNYPIVAMLQYGAQPNFLSAGSPHTAPFTVSASGKTGSGYGYYLSTTVPGEQPLGSDGPPGTTGASGAIYLNDTLP